MTGGARATARAGSARPGVTSRGPYETESGGRLRVLRHYLPVLVGVVIITLVVVIAPSSVPPRSAEAGAATPLVLPDPPNSAGVAVSGVHCGGGVRQVRWSKYAPVCQPAFSGSNGGATTAGVTATTITISTRNAVPPAIVAALGTIGRSIVGTKAQTLAAMQEYVDIFNREFELYGRRVVLKPFDGRGSFATEQAGGGQAQAQQDADRAKSLGAFADVSTISETAPYAQALAQNRLISMGAPYVSSSFLEQNAPYAFTPGPNCSKLSSISTTVIGRGLGRMPAIFAGDPSLRSRPRRIGVAFPSSATYQACDGSIVSDLKDRYHVDVGPVIRYPFTTVGDSADAPNMVAQFKSAGVTTVFCGCDPATIIYLTAAARRQDYRPEWVNINTSDPYNRLADQAQWSHSLAGGHVPQAAAVDEAQVAFRLAGGRGSLVSSYASIYEPLLLLFDALQAAGPNLTPSSFEQGFASLPTSLPGGMYGQWRFGQGTHDASSSFQVESWNPRAISPADGKAGAYQACNGGQEYADVGPPELPANRQLDCFGRPSSTPARNSSSPGGGRRAGGGT
jgi:hypothetical protein